MVQVCSSFTVKRKRQNWKGLPVGMVVGPCDRLCGLEMVCDLEEEYGQHQLKIENSKAPVQNVNLSTMIFEKWGGLV